MYTLYSTISMKSIRKKEEKRKIKKIFNSRKLHMKKHRKALQHVSFINQQKQISRAKGTVTQEFAPKSSEKVTWKCWNTFYIGVQKNAKKVAFTRNTY